GINPKTVATKLVFLGLQAELEHRRTLFKLYQSRGPFRTLQFDEQQSSHQTKLKPLAIPLVVEAKSRLILSLDVCQMPPSGPLARISEKKYGKRADHRLQTLHEVFRGLKAFLPPRGREAQLSSDSHPFYPPVLRRHLPEAHHPTVIGRKGQAAGQGELKK